MSEDVGFERIESLLGVKCYLDPARTNRVPTISEDDDVRQISKKLTRYIMRTQNFDAMDDEAIGAVVDRGLVDAPVDLAKIHSGFRLSGDERLVCVEDPRTESQVMILSVHNQFRKSGSYRLTSGPRVNFYVENLGHLIARRYLQDDFTARFLAGVPEEARSDYSLQVRSLFHRIAETGSRAHKFTQNDVAVFDTRCVRALQAAGLTLDPSSYSVSERLAAIHSLPDGTSRFDFYGEEHLVKTFSLDNQTYSADLAWLLSEANGASPRCLRAEATRAYRAFMVETFQLEEDVANTNEYLRVNSIERSATVYQDKKDIPQTHLDAAASSPLVAAKQFKYVELDAEVDLALFHKIEREYASLVPLLATTVPPQLRFRKTGRHRAIGVYHPSVDNIAVDPRHPNSFIHEYTHHIDFTNPEGRLSSSDEFKPILRDAQRAIRAHADQLRREGGRTLDYHLTPTEVLARTAELAYLWHGVETSLNGSSDSYAHNVAYTTLFDLKEPIMAFWARKTPLGEHLHLLAPKLATIAQNGPVRGREQITLAALAAKVDALARLDYSRTTTTPQHTPLVPQPLLPGL
jgi:hypothetical protein